MRSGAELLLHLAPLNRHISEHSISNPSGSHHRGALYFMAFHTDHGGNK
jgi:hypothetical protein